jgi:hypothetical protein
VSPTGDFFDRFHRSAWRLECRPFYQPDAAEFDRWQHGQPPTLDQQAQRQRWIDNITTASQHGRTVGRVLVVTLPLTPYWQWRVETGRQHAAAGEDIRVADRAKHPDLGDLGDFWMFDDAHALLLDYDPTGGFLHAHPVTDQTALGRYRRQRDQGIAGSVPLAEFLVTR